MKLLIVHNAYQSKLIGGEDLVVEREYHALREALGIDRVFRYVVSNDNLSKIKLITTIWGDRYHANQIYQLVKQHKIDIVHVHNYFPLLTPRIFKAAKAAGAKVIHTLHNYRQFCLSGLLYRPKAPWCTQCVNKRFKWPGILRGCYRGSTLQSGLAASAYAWYQFKDYFKYIDYYFALTHFQKNRLIEFGLPESKIINKPNAIENPIYSQSIHNREGYLFVGRLEEAKGIQLLLSAWKTLDLPLWIIGEPQVSFKQFENKHIHFLGQLSHDVVLEWLGRVKFLVHPAEAVETFGLTIIEAMAMGTPVIGLNRGTRQEFIQSGSNGYLCEPATLAQTVLKAEQANDYAALSQNAMQRATQYFLDNVTKEQIQCYQSLK